MDELYYRDGYIIYQEVWYQENIINISQTETVLCTTKASLIQLIFIRKYYNYYRTRQKTKVFPAAKQLPFSLIKKISDWSLIPIVWTFFLGRIYMSTKYIYIIQQSFQFTVVLPVSMLFIGWQLMAISSYLGVYYPF